MTLSELLIYLISTLVLNQVCVLMRTSNLKEKLIRLEEEFKVMSSRYYISENDRKKLIRDIEDTNIKMHKAYAAQRYEQERLK